MPTTNNPLTPDTPKGLLPLDLSLYNLESDQRTFLKLMTGITDDEELKGHIAKVQAKAYKLTPYPCIRLFTFAKLAVSRFPFYEQVLQLGREREGALLLDIGCCFGNDLRKLASDGWPKENMIASDRCARFWEYGHDLYKSTPESFPVAFIPGDAFDPKILLLRESLYSQPSKPKPTSLTSLTSLNPLQGHLSAIHASLFFHLFDEGKQLDLARRLAGLLTPEPGSKIFGCHYVRSEKGTRTEVLADGLEHTQFWHSPESWKNVWEEQVFRKGSIQVQMEVTLDELSRMELTSRGMYLYYMTWCITRL